MDLLGEDLAERAAEHGEVLAEDEHLAAVDRSPPGDHTVGERSGVLDPEAVRPVTGEHVELDEGAGVEQQIDPLARGELAPLVLALDRRRAPRVERLLPQGRELREPLLDRVRRRDRRRPLVAVERFGFRRVLDVVFLKCHGPARLSGLGFRARDTRDRGLAAPPPTRSVTFSWRGSFGHPREPEGAIG